MLTVLRMRAWIKSSLLLLFLSSWPSILLAEEVMLGEIEFSTSGAPDAKPEFIRGVLYMHSFEYDRAAVAFRQAQDIDPDFAMAYWGEAMTYHHSLWRAQSQQAAQDVLNRLGNTSEARIAQMIL